MSFVRSVGSRGRPWSAEFPPYTWRFGVGRNATCNHTAGTSRFYRSSSVMRYVLWSNRSPSFFSRPTNVSRNVRPTRPGRTGLRCLISVRDDSNGDERYVNRRPLNVVRPVGFVEKPTGNLPRAPESRPVSLKSLSVRPNAFYPAHITRSSRITDGRVDSRRNPSG